MVFLINNQVPTHLQISQEKRLSGYLTYEGSVISRVLTFKPCQSPKRDGSMVWPLFGVLRLLDSNSLTSMGKALPCSLPLGLPLGIANSLSIRSAAGFFFFLQFCDVKLKLQSSIRCLSQIWKKENMKKKKSSILL
jgi:hypothetical protein